MNLKIIHSLVTKADGNSTPITKVFENHPTAEAMIIGVGDDAISIMDEIDSLGIEASIGIVRFNTFNSTCVLFKSVEDLMMVDFLLTSDRLPSKHFIAHQRKDFV